MKLLHALAFFVAGVHFSQNSDYPLENTPSSKVEVVTFNINGQRLSHEVLMEIAEGLNTKGSPKIAVIGVQELMSLNTRGFLEHGLKLIKGEENPLDVLARNFLTAMNEATNQHYVPVGSVTQMGLGLLVFQLDSAPVAQDVRTVTVATDKAHAGNKGGVAVRFTFDGRQLCFVNVHLDSDDGKQKERKKSLETVLKKVAATHKETVVVLGDFNLRLNQPKSPGDPVTRVVQMVSWGQRKKLLEELDESVTMTSFRDQFDEGRINFDPTYRFVPGSKDYSSKRVPAWCDRIFFSKGVKSLVYDALKVQVSDHRPVFAVLELNQPAVTRAERTRKFKLAVCVLKIAVPFGV